MHSKSEHKPYGITVKPHYMKQYSISFSEPIKVTYNGSHWDKDLKKWVDGEYIEMKQHITLFSLASAKKLIKQNRDKYVSSCITKVWSNGDWENLGEIKLSGSNKTFVANSKQKVASY